MEKPQDDHNTPVLTLAAIAGIAYMLTAAFTRQAKNSIVERQGGYVCYYSGKTWDDGYNGHFAHEVGLHKPYPDNDPRNGRWVIVEIHIVETIAEFGEKLGKKMWLNHTIMNYDWIAKQAGKHKDDLTPLDIATYDTKEPFEYYVNLAKQLVSEG